MSKPKKKLINISEKTFFQVAALLAALMLLAILMTCLLPKGEFGTLPDGSPDYLSYQRRDDLGGIQLQAVQDKGAEVLASIPEDYTDLQNEVGDLKSATITYNNLDKDDFESGTYEDGQKVAGGERLRTKQFYDVRKGDTVVWSSSPLQININLLPTGTTSVFGASGWVKSDEPNTYTVPLDGRLYIIVKKEAGGSISINDYSGISIAIYSSLSDRIDRLNTENGYIIRYYNSIEFEQGTFNANTGVNDDNSYNKTRKNRNVVPTFLNKGDIVTVLNKTLRTWLASTSTISNAHYSSGWITDTYTIPETGFYRLQYGYTNDNQINSAHYDYLEQGIVIKSKVVDIQEAIYTYLTGITTAINSTHAYTGQPIDMTKNVFSIGSLTSFGAIPDGTTARQGSAYYNGTLFKFYSFNYVELFNYADLTKIAGYAIDSAHGNCAQFSNEFASSSDSFPLLYVASDDANNTVYVNKVTDSAATLVRTLTFPTATAGYHITFGLDSISQKIYTIGYDINDFQTAAGNGCILCAWDLTKLTDNTGSYTPELISKTSLPFIDTKQDAKFFNGKIFQISSNPYASGSKPTKIYVIGLDGVVTNIIEDLNEPIREHEMEGLCIVPDSNGYGYKLYIDGVLGTRFELLF